MGNHNLISLLYTYIFGLKIKGDFVNKLEIIQSHREITGRELIKNF
jgi:hypothetical protein